MVSKLWWLNKELTVEDGEVWMERELLPGIMKNMTINCMTRSDVLKMKGISGKVKIPMGWEKMQATITMEYLTDEFSTCYEKVKKADVFFRQMDGDYRPLCYKINNAHADARGLQYVEYKGYMTQETDQDDVMLGVITLEEWEPLAAKKEKMKAAEAARKKKEKELNTKSNSTTILKIDAIKTGN